MNIKMTTNSQLSTTESKKQKQTKQTTRTGTGSQTWSLFGGLSVARGRGENGGKGTEIKTHNWLVQNRQGEIKNSIGNGETKELIYRTHGRELSGQEDCERSGVPGRQSLMGKYWDNYNSIINEIHLKK